MKLFTVKNLAIAAAAIGAINMVFEVRNAKKAKRNERMILFLSDSLGVKRENMEVLAKAKRKDLDAAIEKAQKEVNDINAKIMKDALDLEDAEKTAEILKQTNKAKKEAEQKEATKAASKTATAVS